MVSPDVSQAAAFQRPYWQHCGAELFPDTTFEASVDLYCRLTQEVVANEVTVHIEGIDDKQLIESAQHSALGALAYAVAYQSHMADTVANNYTKLNALKGKYQRQRQVN